MNNINNITFNTFYYNGHFSDEFDVYIGGINNSIQIPLTPSIEKQTVKVNGRHGEIITNARYNPRTITIPVYCKNVNQARNISAWLTNLTPTDFYFVGDDVKIKAILDDTAIDITNISYMESLISGTFELKFFCPSPFYKQLVEEHICVIKKQIAGEVVSYNNANLVMPLSNDEVDNIYVVLEPNQNTATFCNNGNTKSSPLIKINTRAVSDVQISINNKNIIVKNVDGWVYIDMYYMNVFKDITNISTNKLTDYEGEFFDIEAGWNNLNIISGNIQSIVINMRTQWI